MSASIATVKVETSVEGRVLVMARVFDAPRERVFEAFTAPERVAQWWGPKGWTLPVCEMEFRPGGAWLYCMRSPDGQESWGKSVYREIVEPERIELTDSFVDESGAAVEGMPVMDAALEFAERDGRTKLTSRTQFASVKDLEAVMDMGVVQGLTETWDRLEEYLGNETR